MTMVESPNGEVRARQPDECVIDSYSHHTLLVDKVKQYQDHLQHTNMYGLLSLLYCIQILSALFSAAENVTKPSNADLWNGTDHEVSNTSPTVLPSASSGEPETSRFTSTQSPTTAIVKPLPNPEATATYNIFFRKECLLMFMVAGGLIIACTILLISTLILVWKVCQLNCRIKELSGNADLISSTEYWMGTGTKNKSKSETETRETTMLMADVSQKQEEKEVGEGGTEKSEDEKEVEDAGNSKEVPTTPAEDLSSSKPQEEAADSQPPCPLPHVAALTSEGGGKPKDVV